MTDTTERVARAMVDRAFEPDHTWETVSEIVREEAMLDAATAIAAMGQSVGVKPLEWQVETQDGPNLFGIVCTAKTSFPGDGDYIIYDEYAEENANGELEMTPLIDDETFGKYYFVGGEHYPTLEDAKAAAQADYEQRIRSCLTPAPAMDAQEAARVLLAETQADSDEEIGPWLRALANQDAWEGG